LKLKQLGEYKLIERLLKKPQKPLSLPGIKTLVPNGDDASVLSFSKNNLVFTTDLLFENVHFSLDWDKALGGRKKLFEALGYKSLAINVSDLSSMGCKDKPIYCLIGVGLPEKIDVKDILHLYNGLSKVCSKYGIQIIGGDTNSSAVLTIAVTVIGTVKKNNITRRSGAKPGDKIYVTGPLGDSAGGLAILLGKNKKAKLQPEINNYLINRHLYPPVLIKNAQKIASRAHCMIDCSDGLINSINLICWASKTGAIIDTTKIPLSKQLSAYSLLTNTSALDYALYGGEDYELIFTSNKTLSNYFCIGEITKKGINYQTNGKNFEIKNNKTYQHFK